MKQLPPPKSEAYLKHLAEPFLAKVGEGAIALSMQTLGEVTGYFTSMVLIADRHAQELIADNMGYEQVQASFHLNGATDGAVQVLTEETFQPMANLFVSNIFAESFAAAREGRKSKVDHLKLAFKGALHSAYKLSESYQKSQAASNDPAMRVVTRT